MAVAVFDYTLWSLRFPALALKVPSALATAYFSEATLLLDNTDASPVVDAGQRLTLLNLLVAHIAALNGATPAGAAGLVGRVSSVSEGSVSISSEFTTRVGSGAWFMQTTWGAEYWALTEPYRQFQYEPGPQPYLDVPGVGPWGPLRWPL